MRQALLSGETLTGCLLHYVRECPGRTVVFPATDERITAAELEEASRRSALALMSRGVGPGDLVALLPGTNPHFLTMFWAVQRAGAACTVLPAPAGFGGQVRAVRRIARIIERAGIRHLILDDTYHELEQPLRELVPGLAIIPPGVAEPGNGAALPSPDPEALSVVQFTSGSTTEPKGVSLTQAAVAAGLHGNVISARFSPDDVFIQWVPTFHDMGLIGLLSHLLNGAQLHLFSPAYFLRHPADFLRYFAEHGGTVLAGPNFSYDRLLDAVADELIADLDLSSWRLAFNGAEPVSAATAARFTATLAPAGVSETVMYPVYGMAEATLSITYPIPGTPVRVLPVDRMALAEAGKVVVVAPGDRAAKDVVSCGYPIHGIELRLVKEDGTGCADGELGEIQICGPALTGGYYRDPVSTAAAFDGRWLRTGDLGFRHEGQLYIAGRAKEMVIVHGQNYFPDDIEKIAREVPGVYRGRCVAFSDRDPDDSEVIRVVAEVHPRFSAAEVTAEIAVQVERELGFSRVRVNPVRPRWITRTTSGKWQRTLARSRIAELVGSHTDRVPDPTEEGEQAQ